MASIFRSYQSFLARKPLLGNILTCGVSPFFFFFFLLSSQFIAIAPSCGLALSVGIIGGLGLGVEVVILVHRWDGADASRHCLLLVIVSSFHLPTHPSEGFGMAYESIGRIGYDGQDTMARDSIGNQHRNLEPGLGPSTPWNGKTSREDIRGGGPDFEMAQLDVKAMGRNGMEQKTDTDDSYRPADC
jgi:hypothetical protein